MRALAILGLVLCLVPRAAFAADGKPDGGKAKKKDGKLDTGIGKIDFKLPDLPKTGEMKNNTQDATAVDPTQKTAAEGPELKVKKVIHAQGFRGGGNFACVAKGVYSGFELAKFPDNVMPFQTCVHIESGKGARTSIQVAVLAPNGDDVMKADDVLSVSPKQKAFDYVVSWDGFTAKKPGNYTVRITIGDTIAGEFPLPVTEKGEKVDPKAAPKEEKKDGKEESLEGLPKN